MSKRATTGLSYLAVCLSLIGVSDSVAADNGAWYSNGYVQKTSLLRKPSGEISESEICEWSETVKELSCATLDAEPSISKTRYNSSGRIVLEQTGRGDQDWESTTTTSYQDDRIFEVAKSSSPTSRFADVTRYNWQADTLVSKAYYYGAYPAVDESQFVPEKINWNDGRINSIEPNAAAENRPAHDEREVYSYKNNGQVQNISLEDWNPESQVWTPKSSASFHYSTVGNITHIEYFDSKGLLENTRVFTWQKTDSVVENISYTTGRL